MNWLNTQPAFGPMSGTESTYSSIWLITSVVVLSLIVLIGWYIIRYFRNFKNK
ncbi:hypothetical protein M3231_12435 [Neobacillus mesonae]|nr:hypothetical protein [Neobacillus mesonae]